MSLLQQRYDDVHARLEQAQASALDETQAWQLRVREASRVAAARASELALQTRRMSTLLEAVEKLASVADSVDDDGGAASARDRTGDADNSGGGGDGEADATQLGRRVAHIHTLIRKTLTKVTVSVTNMKRTIVSTTRVARLESAAVGGSASEDAANVATELKHAQEALADMTRLRDMTAERLHSTLARVVELEVCTDGVVASPSCCGVCSTTSVCGCLPQNPQSWPLTLFVFVVGFCVILHRARWTTAMLVPTGSSRCFKWPRQMAQRQPSQRRKRSGLRSWPRSTKTRDGMPRHDWWGTRTESSASTTSFKCGRRTVSSRTCVVWELFCLAWLVGGARHVDTAD